MVEKIFNLISLKVKCPVCGHSLMDDKRLVDNCPSIRVKVAVGEKEGTINLSSVYESYNYVCDIDTPGDQIVRLFCPHCSSEIKSKSECDLCHAHMIPFDLELGGNVSVCSRIGCKNHFVKFVDFTFALKKLYLDAGAMERPYLEDMSAALKPKGPKTPEEEKIEIMRTGTFLQSYCPHCKQSLIEQGSIKLKVDRETGTGFLMLSPYLNVFTSRSTIFLPEDQFIGDIKCFHCDKSLMVDDMKCEECGSDVFRIVLTAAMRLVDFYICSKKGCRWHGLSKEDLNYLRLEDSLEY
jgi:ssDNA-binding Zn-finger/Zn-ribbon topoisomerase 1